MLFVRFELHDSVSLSVWIFLKRKLKGKERKGRQHVKERRLVWLSHWFVFSCCSVPFLYSFFLSVSPVYLFVCLYVCLSICLSAFWIVMACLFDSLLVWVFFLCHFDSFVARLLIVRRKLACLWLSDLVLSFSICLSLFLSRLLVWFPSLFSFHFSCFLFIFLAFAYGSRIHLRFFQSFASPCPFAETPEYLRRQFETLTLASREQMQSLKQDLTKQFEYVQLTHFLFFASLTFSFFISLVSEIEAELRVVQSFTWN